jgi:beta-CASP RNase J family ribonuclease
MNCMLVGVNDRYILIDAGLMFPDFSDLGMQKILPDTSFLAQWRDKIEAVVITHGHEDHIGALPWVVPALDPGTPIYAGGFAMQLIKRRLQEFNLWDGSRMHTLEVRKAFQCGPFEVEPLRVTHSIPDCCGLIMRSEFGTIVHTGDWKIDENPVDGDGFDRDYFYELGKENVTLFMSDSTNVLSPGRTTSESDVERNLVRRVMGHHGKGRVVTTQFASNLHRLASVKKAADAAGRKICFIGMSLNTYLEAAHREGRAPINPKDLVPSSAIDDMDPNELLVVTTGSQGEPRAALNLASRDASHLLKLRNSDLLLYSAKIIPGNDTKVVQMMNRIAEIGPEIAMSREEGLHTSGHAYKDELQEILRAVKPQHFLPVHGEYSFLCAHAQLGRDSGILNTSVIRNGQMLGVHDRRNKNTVSMGSAAMLGEAKLVNFYNDGNKGTGTAAEMSLQQRQHIATEGVVVAAVDVIRDPAVISVVAALSKQDGEVDDKDATTSALQEASRRRLKAKIRITTRAMWTDGGKLLELLHTSAEAAIAKLPGDAALSAVERVVGDSLRRAAKQFNGRKPEVIVVSHEADPRMGAAAGAMAKRRSSRDLRDARGGERDDSRGRRPSTPPGKPKRPAGGGAGPPRGRGRPPKGPPPLERLSPDMIDQRKKNNPRDKPDSGGDVEYP